VNSSGWLALATAAAALAGGFLGALIQGTASVRGWRRQTRLDAYTTFVKAEHAFHNSVIDLISAVGLPQYGEKVRAMLDAELALYQAASLVSIAGPMACVDAAETVTRASLKLSGDLSDRDLAAAAAKADATPEGYPGLAGWISTAGFFERTARKILGTEHLDGQVLRIKRASARP
jgi:hypothetical protein